ncbi:hypothetical protein DSO57_1022310 [Entomophthora muscae]|uniref:Uncharacterized protein n=2 Tax=Entomophthora muscae TaxID=34485 RepID=A0ACC2SFS0_9FUNG|nr:hypothetical protein DSO57_1022309 [Entomophthora muscae]KAJ9061254.1 hypothetical protein DSO57_1022310 [Entomophthora muscae]
MAPFSKLFARSAIIGSNITNTVSEDGGTVTNDNQHGFQHLKGSATPLPRLYTGSTIIGDDISNTVSTGDATITNNNQHSYKNPNVNAGTTDNDDLNQYFDDVTAPFSNLFARSTIIGDDISNTVSTGDVTITKDNQHSYKKHNANVDTTDNQPLSKHPKAEKCQSQYQKK